MSGSIDVLWMWIYVSDEAPRAVGRGLTTVGKLEVRRAGTLTRMMIPSPRDRESAGEAGKLYDAYQRSDEFRVSHACPEPVDSSLRRVLIDVHPVSKLIRCSNFR
jgi:hypothetical protein